MDNLLEEYGFIIVTILCATILVVGITAGLSHEGFLGGTIISYVNSLLGGGS